MGRPTSPLPPKCFAVLPGNGRLVTITRNEPGYLHSSLDKGDREENRRIADVENQKLGGVTHEQEKRMIDGAVVGWAVDMLIQAQRSSAVGACITVILCSPGRPSSRVRLDLPASAWNVLDALERLGVPDHTDCLVSPLSCQLVPLETLLPPNPNLYELNQLAQRLDVMSDWELDCFEGMIMMDAAKNGDAVIPLERLINMTLSTADCQVAYGVHDDAALGKFYVDNDFPVIPENLPEVLYEILDYKAIGRKARIGEGGVFTDKGYVVSGGELDQTYHSGEKMCCEKPEYAVLIQVRKCRGNDPRYDSDLVATLKLPADESAIDHAVETVGAASLSECIFHIEDCIVPGMLEMVAEELDMCEGDITVVDDFSKQLLQMDQDGTLPVFKAMLSTSYDELSLDDAIELSQYTVQFGLNKEFRTPAECACQELLKCNIAERNALLEILDLHSYGKKLLEGRKEICSSYGVLYSSSGQTMAQCLEKLSRGRKMEIGGM